MNSKKFILLSCVVPCVFAVSTAMAAQRTMQTAPMHPVHPARAPMMTNSTSGFHRFNDGHFRRFNDGDFDRDDRFRRFRRFNDFVFFDFGFPFFYPYPYYYPYSYGYYAPYQDGYGVSVSIVIQVQRRLAHAGYYHGAIDGVMGPRTRYAIRAYERNRGLPIDGTISRQLLTTMGGRY